MRSPHPLPKRQHRSLKPIKSFDPKEFLANAGNRQDSSPVWPEAGHLFSRKACGRGVLHSGGENTAQRGLQTGQGSSHRAARA